MSIAPDVIFAVYVGGTAYRVEPVTLPVAALRPGAPPALVVTLK